MHSLSIYAACAELTHTPHRELRSGDTDDNACELRCHELQHAELQVVARAS
jgi:hypothetical protein